MKFAEYFLFCCFYWVSNIDKIKIEKKMQDVFSVATLIFFKIDN